MKYQAPSALTDTPTSGPTWASPLHWLAKLWWKLFALVILGNYLPGAGIALVQTGLAGLLTYLTSWGLLQPIEKHYPLVFWSVAVLLGLLALLGLGTDLEEQRRKAEERARLRRQTLEAHMTALTAQSTAQEALETVKTLRFDVATSATAPHPLVGPPDDDATILPTPPAHFVGRRADLLWVLDRLRTGTGGGPSAGPTSGRPTGIIALLGLAGIGKTTLVTEAVHQLKQEGCFPGGIAVVICNGKNDPAEVLRDVLMRFDPYRKAPEATELAQLRDLAQATLRGKAALVVLDNVEPDLDLIQVLAPLRAAELKVVVTARQTLPGEAIAPADSRTLKLLSPQEALELFVSTLQTGEPAPTMTSEDQVLAQEIVGEVGYHTLAVRLAAAYAATEHRDLKTLASELRSPANILDLPKDETPQAVRSTFALTLDRLPPEAQHLFAGLAAFPTAECGRQAVLALGTALGQTDPKYNLGLLLRRTLVETSPDVAKLKQGDRERVRLHPLLRALAKEKFGGWPITDRTKAQHALLQYFAGYAQVHQTDYAALAADEQNLMGTLDWALETTPEMIATSDQTPLLADLTHGMREFWRDRRQWQEGKRFLAGGIEAAEARLAIEAGGEVRQQLAELNLAYGQILIYSGAPEDGGRAVQRSLSDFRIVHQRAGEGQALYALGEAALWRGQYDEGESLFRQSLEISREVENRQGVADALTQLGHIAVFHGQYTEAQTYLQQGLEIAREMQDQQSEGVALGQLGQVALRRGQFTEAQTYLQQGLEIAREMQDRQSEGVALHLLAWVPLRRRQFTEAEKLLQKSLTLFRNVKDRLDEGAVLATLGELDLRRGQFTEAEHLLQQSLEIAREVQDRQSEGIALGLQGQVALQRGLWAEAEDLLQQGLTSAREIHDYPWEVASCRNLGRVAEARHDLASARDFYRDSLKLAMDCGMGPDAAETQRALGDLLAERLDQREEGCALLLDALRRFSEFGMPEADEVRYVVERLGCN